MKKHTRKLAMITACAAVAAIGLGDFATEAGAMPRSVMESIEYAYWYYFLR
ncbi:hypothetical protein [Paenibacillus mucilaginosus]|uniref:Uncharacterized protein n=3 Tax=Paenibacillus mucilaginosus TaxID=61624 RepID=H6NPJ1_9BACL|nr:hypothetical protein [Paenibacillus mucilaginosus]AEI44851.1 hypothetical protein KNP414_06330 [Paenibacillus mucilaginosus KNP414]AFC32603.1 hypothetical protein PM3016_5944 [Paenibacillus mucilaginosus 3016]AFH64930.1 hypothetical protein B2K_30220 [Paenibacillus mucilaginosus K02]MCG7214897.1 hypothetical protein [Paenibacillus mucilaginosus]WDM26375.1 hypothetical protein KCX80_28720 [Paenibacillus mucilaginosus]